MAPKVSHFLNRTVLVSIPGLFEGGHARPFRLLDIEAQGLWLQSEELSRRLLAGEMQALVSAEPAVFVPFAQIAGVLAPTKALPSPPVNVRVSPKASALPPASAGASVSRKASALPSASAEASAPPRASARKARASGVKPKAPLRKNKTAGAKPKTTRRKVRTLKAKRK
jgi:hypothetical protein